ncbi:MAG: VCBS repeat-containing protein [Planctomycetota bacterium]
MLRTTLSLLAFAALIQAGLLQETGALGQEASTSREVLPVLGPSLFFGDFDGDRLEDAYAISPGREDRLLRNRGDGDFEDVTYASGLSGISGTAQVLWEDFDRDGSLDLFLVSYRGSHLFRNLGGRFMDVTTVAGLESSSPDHWASFTDYDRDEHPDLFVRTSTGDILYHNLGYGSFRRVELGEENALGPLVEPRTPGAVVTIPGVTGDRDNTVDPGGLQQSTPERDGEPREDLGRSRPSHATRTVVSPPSLASAPIIPTNPIAPLATSCIPSLQDQALPTNCLSASSVPTLGMLYPLTQNLCVSSAGYVGIGTTSPSRRLELLDPQAILRLTTTTSGASVLELKNNLGSPAELGAVNFVTSSGSTPGQIIYRGSENAMTFKTNSAERMRIDSSGNVGIGTSTPGRRLEVQDWGATARLTTTGYQYGSVLELRNSASQQDDLGAINWQNNTGATPGQIRYRGNENAMLFVTDSAERMRINSLGWVGIGTNSPARSLEVQWQQAIARLTTTDNMYGSVVELRNVFSAQDDLGAINWQNNTGATPGQIRYRGNENAMLFVTNATERLRIDSSGNVGIGTSSPTSKLHVNGTTTTNVLTITGGADLVESFETGEERCEPGTVVVIDEKHLGRLKMSSLAYDTKVAGVVSGAGGILPGIRLGQDGVTHGDTLVAMTGRVFVKCSAESGAIRPGDLLTTASLAGHAMKASDPERRFGAVIGKAMSSLEEGTGLVLVLVNLQ